MSIKVFITKKGDTGIPLEATLFDASGAVNLTNVAVRLRMFTSLGGGFKINNAPCTIADQTARKGVVIYNWQAADVDTAGEYKIEFVATLPDGREITFPRDKINPFGKVIVLDSAD